jgi:hypothetical protein
MVPEFKELAGLYVIQDAIIYQAVIGALIILLGYAMLKRTRPAWLADRLRLLFTSLLLSMDVIMLIALMVVKRSQ